MRELTVVLRELTLGLMVLTLGLKILILCQRAKHSYNLREVTLNL